MADLVNPPSVRREAPCVRGLRSRLASDTLRPRDKERMAFTQRIRTLRKQGRTLAQCAQEMGVGESKVVQFTRRGMYKIFCEYLATAEQAAQEITGSDVVRQARQEFATLAPDAMAYFRSCYQRHPPEDQPALGLFKDDAKAMWATDKVAKGLGLTEPEHAVRPVIHINVGSIRVEMAQVAADDAEAARAAKVIDVTPTPA